MKKTTLIGLLGTNLDAAPDTAARWEKWRPSVDLCRHEDFLVHRFILLHQPRDTRLANRIAADIRLVSPETETRLVPLAFDDPWDFEAVYTRLHDFSRRFNFDPDNNDYYFHISTGTHVAQICFYLLTEAGYFPGKLIQSAPPKHQRAGEPGKYFVIDLDLSRYDLIANRFEQEHRQGTDFLKSGIKTRNRSFNELIQLIEKVAINSRAPILLTGPTGAGKSQLARRIYELKKARAQLTGGFVEINCATLRGDNAMSALFGHLKGAFTGATRDRAGLLKNAHKGILFLDEIAELGIDEQAMLLRAIEEKRFFPLGADQETHADFQLIAGTNRDLREEVADGRFREDLLARINLWTFALPGLKDRREDIAPNIEHELERYAQNEGVLVRFNREAHRAFLQFAQSDQASWSANFRDLNASITRMATLSGGKRISTQIVKDEIQRLQYAWKKAPGVPASQSTDDELLSRYLDPQRLASLDLFERPQLALVIRVCLESDSLAEAGRKLFAQSRKKRTHPNDSDRLRKYLEKYRLRMQGSRLQNSETGRK